MSNNNPSLGDRFAEISVLVITLIALFAGWTFKSSVENRAVAFEAEGVSAQAPAGWLQAQPVGDELLHTTDRSSGVFGTTYVVRKMPVPTDASAGSIASLLTLDYAQKMTAFRVLDQREVTVYGHKAYELSYVYVDSNPDPTHVSAPSVVQGLDYIFLSGDQAVVVTYWAGEENYQSDLDRFHVFLDSVKY